MRRSQSRQITSSIILAVAALLPAAVFADDGVSEAYIDRAGLTVQWFTNAGTSGTTKLVDWHLNVNENLPTTYFTISAGKYRETFSQNKLDAFGEPMGIDGAVDYIDIRKEILMAEFANDGIKDIKFKVDQYTLPLTTIYTLTSNGVVKAIDADSGQTRWSTQVGDQRFPSIGLGSSDELVAVINGSHLYVLEAATGKILWDRKCRYAVGSSPAVADDKIFVPLINGRLESFVIEDKGINSQAFVQRGEGTARPIVTEQVVAWPNNQGNFNVAGRFRTKSVAYQLRSDDAIVCAPVYEDGAFYVTSLDGFIYAIDEEKGSLNWQASTGARIAESPVVHKGFVFVVNENRELFKFDAKSGVLAEGWETPRENISKFLGASKDNLYVVDRFGQLMTISQSTGLTLSTVKFGDVSAVLPNRDTDRIYVASKRGLIQCIREQGKVLPYFHNNDAFGAKDVDKSGSAKPANSNSGNQGDDPFKQADPDADPFSNSSAPDSNPFGDSSKSSDEDPFSGGSKKSSEDEDPFK